MTLRTRARKGPAFRVPERLSSFDATWSTRADAPIRRVPLSFQPMEWSLGGRTFAMSEVAPEETVAAGSTHLWEFVNLTNQMMGMQAAHPIHCTAASFVWSLERADAPRTPCAPASLTPGGKTRCWCYPERPFACR